MWFNGFQYFDLLCVISVLACIMAVSVKYMVYTYYIDGYNDNSCHIDHNNDTGNDDNEDDDWNN